jgi:hypothetical protein
MDDPNQPSLETADSYTTKTTEWANLVFEAIQFGWKYSFLCALS